MMMFMDFPSKNDGFSVEKNRSTSRNPRGTPGQTWCSSEAADTTTEADSEGAGEGLAEAMSDVAQSCLAVWKKPMEKPWKVAIEWYI